MGSWWSGLRISEAVRLSWDTSASVRVVVREGFHPALYFSPEGHKGRRGELVPIAPEFAELLLAVPEDERVGLVFPLSSGRGDPGGVVAKIGRAARIVTNEKTRKPATAQDYRRSFGTRWAKRVMPVVLQRLMRHKAIQTTLAYYVEQDVEDVGEAVWEAFRKEKGNTSGNSRSETPVFSGRNRPR